MEEKLSSLLKEREKDQPSKGIDVENLSLILRLTCSLTSKARHAGGDFYYRSVASAGALYPTEIYVATHALNDLDDGLYHFAVRRHGLFPLRVHDLSRCIVEISQLPERKAPVLTFFLTAIFFRSAWKYRERSYRYDLLDTGHLVENLTLALKAFNLPFRLSYDFDDRRINHLLGLDALKEVALAMVQVVGEEPVFVDGEQEIEEMTEDIKGASRVSGNEIDYPAIGEIHGAGMSMIIKEEAGPEMIHELGVAPETWMKNEDPSPWPEVLSYPNALFHRRSRRNFVKESLRKDFLMALLDCLCIKGFLSSNREEVYGRTVCTGFLLGDAEGLSPGFYLLDTVRKSTGLVQPGLFMERMARISLDQAWLAHTALHFLFFTNLDFLDRVWGPRGYRYAMMAAGRMGERLYITATTLGLGCCGIGAFYDGEAAELLGLNKESRLLYLVAVGTVKALKAKGF
jgi:SagB-type dehydrogenase family enzyme